MKQLLLALGVTLVISVPSLATPHAVSDPFFRNEFFKNDPIKGKVTNDKGEPLSGVTVQVKGSAKSVVTDADGNYSIDVPANAALVFTYVGMESQTVSAGGKTMLNLKMKGIESTLNDVVVVGYGTKKKANVIGAVSSIRAEEVEDLPVANLGTALMNRVPGVGVSVASGKPGATTTISIRNPTTFSASAGLGLTSDPLYVIDGLILPKTDFDNLDASLIESITFLKDASAAVYGAAGAKGVVLVTTKKGKPGKPKISYTGYYGHSDATVKPKVLSAYEHAKMLNDGYELNNSAFNSRFSQNDLNYLATDPYKSWYDEFWKPAGLMRQVINVSGGNDRVTFFAGGNYYKETGNYADISIQKYGIRSGMNAKITDGLTANISLNTDFSRDNRNTLKGASAETDDQTIRALFLTPQWVPLSLNGKYNAWNGPNPPGRWNPQAMFETESYKWNKSQGMTLNTSLEYKPAFVKGLTARVQFGKVNRSGGSKEYYAPYIAYDLGTMGQNGLLFDTAKNATATSRTISNNDQILTNSNNASSYQVNASLAYARSIGKHDFDVMVLSEQNESTSDVLQVYRTGQLIPDVDQYWAYPITTTTIQTATNNEAGKRSYLGRANYSFDNKYLVEVIARYDGSANFHPDYRWGLFPSVGLAWRLSEENFIRDNFHFINNLKVRANYGLVGDDRVNNYQYKARYTQTTGALFGTTPSNGLDPSIVPNPQISWEKARTKNLGVDAELFKNKLSVTAEFYHRHTYDGLDNMSNSTIPTTAGVTTGITNYGIQDSWGTEFSIGYRGSVTRDLKFNVDLNFGTSDNQMIQTYYNPNNLALPYEEYKVMIGKSSRKYNGSNYGFIAKEILRTQAEVDALLAKNPNYKIGGVKPQVGFLDYVDVNNDGKIDDWDIVPMFDNTSTIVGGGLSVGLSWKDLKFNTNIQWSFGGKKFYDSEARKVPTTTQNAVEFWADHWTAENPNAKFPRADAPLAKENSTFWAVTGTTSRINNMVLSYKMPKRISEALRIPDFRAVITGTNLWSLYNPLKYKDPSTSNFASYPTLRTISLGINASL
ncbi:SusC/RagA family TonB-linked outer membrane protein [Paraflavisolibacter sp. H34]|uniref:SusC/RagA family TonB-linked outer membrane protein n=1 Tax=Huijunlia imazamoxiresistens TaxID=3127457 RepID=UPI00301A7B82